MKLEYDKIEKQIFIFKNINNMLINNEESRYILNKIWVKYIIDKWLIYFTPPKL